MSVSGENWDQLVQFLHQKKITGIFQFILEAGSPIKILISQSFYLITPFLQNNYWEKLAEIIENPKTAFEFLEYLRSQE